MAAENIDPSFVTTLQTCMSQVCRINLVPFKKFLFLHRFTQNTSSWGKQNGPVWNQGGSAFSVVMTGRGCCHCTSVASAFWVHVDAVKFGNDG